MDEETLAALRSNDLGRAIEPAILRLLTDDAYLFEVDVNERSVTHRLGMYLQNAFPKFDVDCEYNRDGHEPKRVFGWHDSEARVYPDIIVHHRGTDYNLLVVEVKLSSNNADPEEDRAKLRQYVIELEYRNALFLVFQVGAEFCLSHAEWIDSP